MASGAPGSSCLQDHAGSHGTGCFAGRLTPRCDEHATSRQGAAQLPLCVEQHAAASHTRHSRTCIHVPLILVLLAVHAVPALVVGLVDVAPLPHALQHLAGRRRAGSRWQVGALGGVGSGRQPHRHGNHSCSPVPRSMHELGNRQAGTAGSAAWAPTWQTSASCLASVVRMNES